MKKIILAAGNQGKIKEFTTFFNLYNINALSLVDIDQVIPTVEETGTTFAENASLKSEQVMQIVNKPTIADDSGLIIDALDGQPGIYSARYAGVDSTDEENYLKVLMKMKEIPLEARTARFTCVLALSIPDKQTIHFTGYCEGTIGFSVEGTNGFGYDPIFIPKGMNKTIAQLSGTEKNKISHRAEAFKQLSNWLQDHSYKR